MKRRLVPPRPGRPPSKRWLQHQQALARKPWTEQWMRTLSDADLLLLGGLAAQRMREAQRAGLAVSDEDLRRSRLVHREQQRRHRLGGLPEPGLPRGNPA